MEQWNGMDSEQQLQWLQGEIDRLVSESYVAGAEGGASNVMVVGGPLGPDDDVSSR